MRGLRSLRDTEPLPDPKRRSVRPGRRRLAAWASVFTLAAVTLPGAASGADARTSITSAVASFAAPSAQSTTRSPAGAAPDLSDEFVRRDGTGLTLAGRPFRFTGINVYMAASGGHPTSCGGSLYPDLSVPLTHLHTGSVIRFWAFQNFFVSHGRFDWSNVDEVLEIAAARGAKVIPVLANQYAYCDGSEKDLSWYRGGYASTIGRSDLLPYRAYVSAMVHRYAGDPTIAMWQLVNEGQAVKRDGSCDEAAALKGLQSFARDVAGLVHTLDPNHLVSLGTLAGYSGSGRQWCGARDSDFGTLMASPGNDICDFHDYGYPAEPMGMPNGPGLAAAIRMCHAQSRPIMVGETGIFAVSSAGLKPRAKQFQEKFSAQFRAGVVGELLWTWAVKPHYIVPAQDPDYGVSPGDPSLAVLTAFGAQQPIIGASGIRIR